jgi:peptide/nickel transport system substrate-binding protein
MEKRKGGTKMKTLRIHLIAVLLLLGVFICVAWAQTPRVGGTLVTSTYGNITSLNPIWKYDQPAFMISQNIYSTLVISDWGIAEGAKPYGDLAKSWEISDDGLTYTFHLYDNVYWHDGEKFTSADVKFTYDTAISKKYPIASYLKLVKEIRTPDENTVVFKLSDVNAPFLPMFANASNWYGQIIPKHLYDGTDIQTNPYNKKPVGTGPFKFLEWKDGQFVSLQVNDKYFRERAYLDKIVWRIYTNKEIPQADFISGNLHLLMYELIPPFHQLKALASKPGVKMWEQKSIYDRCLLFNHKRKPFNDIRVREAISLAINRDEVSQLAWAGLWRPNYHASSAGSPLFTNFKVRWPEQDLKRAQQLLDEAGYPPDSQGVRLKPVLIATDYLRPMVEVIIQQLKKIGVQVKFDLSETATWLSRLGSGDFDLTPYYIRFGPDPDSYGEHFGTGAPRNLGKYSNATLDELVKAGRKTLNVSKRKEIYDKVQEILRKDFAYLPVTQSGYFQFSTEKLHGVTFGDPTSYGKSFGWGGYRACWLEE